MQVRQFEYVREIAATGSITQAAQKLFVSKQALSEMLKLLEEELGFRIFERSSRGVKPTKAGEKFLLDLENDTPYWLCVLYHDNNDAVYADTLERIMEYFEQYV